jgi:hypothetical protein
MSEPLTYTVEEYEEITRYMSEDMDHMKKMIDLLLQQVDVLNARIALYRA